MRKDKLTQILVMFSLIVIVFGMSIYYAVRSYTDLIDTEGTVAIEALNEWDINFLWDSYKVTDGSVDGDVTFGATYITYSATLKNPGEYYEFTVDVMNKGYLAGLLNYAVVSVEGDGRDYTTRTIMYDGMELNEGLNDNLNNVIYPNKIKTMLFRVEYTDPEDWHDLPHEDKTVKITAAFNYVDYDNK